MHSSGSPLSPSDPRREPLTFTLETSRPLGTKRGKGRGSFVADTRGQAIGFYRDLIQQLTAWRPKAPKLPDEPEPIVESEGLPETVATSTPPEFMDDGQRDPGEAIEPAVVAPQPT